ncbi:uncharacterized protein C9orf40 homolog [Labrus bergylta]|uniref:uncharacterized protein C9orf40 homolog n=1 Tax=Labrus bergylta TaxID=56723 RepID=UPI0009B408C0|nr:uncharacterized protein C9orf40 homolog [Labrus bergylta]
MAKRRAEDTLLHDAAPKRCYRSLCSVDMQPGGMAPSGGVSPPSLLALLGNRCRKRPHYFEEPEKQEEESALSLKPTKCDIRKHGAQVLSKVQTSGGSQERHNASTPTSSKKRTREDCTGSETALPKSNNEADADTDAEDCTYNSFQYWRVPLPELDLSLLEDNNDHTQTKNKSKEKYSSSDTMEA